MIRDAQARDLPWICEIWNEVIRDTALTFTTDEKTVAGLAPLLDAAPFLILEDEGGFATYGPFRLGPGYQHTKEHSIYLAPGARGQGRAASLLATLETRAVEIGVHSFVAGIAGENAAAQRFHARQGYAQVGRIPQAGRKFDRWHDLVLMQKFLT